MGTRSLTIIVDDSGDAPRELCVLYRQFDGYPKGHGAELAEILKPMRMTNGISGSTVNLANGPGCLAAQIIMHLKRGVQDLDSPYDSRHGFAGGIYLEPAGTRDSGEEYTYTVTANYERINLKVERAGWKETMRRSGNNYVTRATPIVHPSVTLYEGPAAEFNPDAAEATEAAAAAA